MNVVPDLLPNMRPTLDLRVNFPEAPPDNVYQRTRVKRDYEKVEPGIFLLPEQVGPMFVVVCSFIDDPADS